MSMLGNIISKIFGHPAQAAEAAPAGSSPTAGTTASSGVAPQPTPGAATGQQVDVAEVLDGMAAKAGQKLNWRSSIVDLMKLVGLDSSLAARKELATDLHYTGDENDSATMNIWLHKQVMAKLAANGGKVPDDLK
ncbi:MAG: hypothetical protein JWN07_436 [Hyphomicrobiales bacterium]|nr:hypothetical protein [Hyphomicrobiales bacterium]